MEIPDASARRLADICVQWNKAERAIKVAEQIDGEIVNPAIYELRYGGRRIVEAIQKFSEGEVVEADNLLKDAYFDCCRSRHDAIDAATAKIAADLAIAVKLLGPHNVLNLFTDYATLVGELTTIRTLVADSREHRNNRDKIYETIAADNLDTIVVLYNRFKASEPEMIATASNARRSYFFNRWTTIAALVVAAVAIFL